MPHQDHRAALSEIVHDVLERLRLVFSMAGARHGQRRNKKPVWPEISPFISTHSPKRFLRCINELFDLFHTFFPRRGSRPPMRHRPPQSPVWPQHAAIASPTLSGLRPPARSHGVCPGMTAGSTSQKRRHDRRAGQRPSADVRRNRSLSATPSYCAATSKSAAPAIPNAFQTSVFRLQPMVNSATSSGCLATHAAEE